ncbi:MAG: hypothetical protein ACE5J4_02320 [Candidatus Aenigmatarchaeota archaeon]
MLKPSVGVGFIKNWHKIGGFAFTIIIISILIYFMGVDPTISIGMIFSTISFTLAIITNYLYSKITKKVWFSSTIIVFLVFMFFSGFSTLIEFYSSVLSFLIALGFTGIITLIYYIFDSLFEIIACKIQRSTVCKLENIYVRTFYVILSTIIISSILVILFINLTGV